MLKVRLTDREAAYLRVLVTDQAFAMDRACADSTRTSGVHQMAQDSRTVCDHLLQKLRQDPTRPGHCADSRLEAVSHIAKRTLEGKPRKCDLQHVAEVAADEAEQYERD